MYIFIFYWCIVALQCVLVSGVQRRESALCIHRSPHSWTFLPPLSVITERQAELPVRYTSFPLAMCFTPGSVYMSIPVSQFVPTSPSFTVSTCPFSMSASLFPPWKLAHLYHFPRFHMFHPTWYRNLVNDTYVLKWYFLMCLTLK